MTRITQDQLTTSTLSRLQRRLEQVQDASATVASGKQIQQPSDDPARANRSMVLRADEAARRQQQRNARDAASRLELTDSTLQSMGDRLHRARDLTVQGARGDASQAELEAIADELMGIREELVSLGNRSHAGTPLFAGWQAGPAVQPDGSGGYDFHPPGSQPITRVIGPNDDVEINRTAGQIFGAGGGESTLALIERIAGHLRAGELEQASGALEDLDGARETLNAHRSALGVAHNRVRNALQRAEADLIAVTEERSQVEDADLTEAVMEMKTQEVAYEAALGSLSRVIQPSLMDFLR